MKSFGIHLFLGVIWLFLSSDRSAFTFFVGFVMGFIILFVFQDVLGTSDYVRRVVAFCKWLWNFLKAFIVSNLNVAMIVLFRRTSKLRPGFMVYDIRGMSETEVIILSQTMTLTPGTTAVEPNMETGKLLVHVLDASDIESTRRSIDRQLRDPLLAFIR